jgi:hypothetical protein
VAERLSTIMLKPLDLEPELLEDLCADELAVAVVGIFAMSGDDLAVERCQDGEIRGWNRARNNSGKALGPSFENTG